MVRVLSLLLSGAAAFMAPAQADMAITLLELDSKCVKQMQQHLFFCPPPPQNGGSWGITKQQNVYREKSNDVFKFIYLERI